MKRTALVILALMLIGMTAFTQHFTESKAEHDSLAKILAAKLETLTEKDPELAELLTLGIQLSGDNIVEKSRLIAIQEIKRRAVELPVKTDTTTWRAYGLEPGKKYRGLIITRIDSVRRAEEEARYAVEDDLTNVSETVSEITAVVIKDETPVAVSASRTIPAHEAAMERLKARRRAAIAAAAGKQ